MSAVGAMATVVEPVMPWTLPKPWTVPREWVGERCFILCSGESIGAQTEAIKTLRGRFIAVKHGVFLKPDADVLFVSGDRPIETVELLKAFTGTHAIIRSKMRPEYDPFHVKRVARAKDHATLCDLTDHVSGRDLGTSAINLAYHFGATEIVLLGYDMRGGHYCTHANQNPALAHFRRHVEFLMAFAADAKTKGVRIVNCSPTSAVKAFETQPLGAFL